MNPPRMRERALEQNDLLQPTETESISDGVVRRRQWDRARLSSYRMLDNVCQGPRQVCLEVEFLQARKREHTSGIR